MYFCDFGASQQLGKWNYSEYLHFLLPLKQSTFFTEFHTASQTNNPEQMGLGSVAKKQKTFALLEGSAPSEYSRF